MGGRPMSEAIQAYLGGSSLPTSRFAALNRMAAKHRPGLTESTSPTAARWYYPAVAAAVAALLVMAAVWITLQPGVPTVAVVYQHIADEVATSHMKLKPLEVRSGDMLDVRRFFDPLGFTLIESSVFEDTSWLIMGGRFCTIRGEAAAQLRMRGAQGRTQTVYQVPYDAAVHHDMPDVTRDETPMRLYSHGLEVRLWRERGLLLATVSATQ